MPIQGKQLAADTITDREVATSAPSQGIGGGNTEGSSTQLSLADHDHTIRETGGATDLTVGVIGDGDLIERSGTSLAGTATVSDTQHGSRGGGTLHAGATQSVAGFMSSSDKQKLDSLQDAAGLEIKPTVRAATTVAGTLATDFENLDVIDGVTLATGNRILIKDQASAIENGIYIVAASGAPARASDQPAAGSHGNDRVFVEDGKVNADCGFMITNDPPNDITGTDNMDWVLFFKPVRTPRQEAVTTQTINNADTALTDTLNFDPFDDASLVLYLNGVMLRQGAGNDYSISGQTITWLALSGTAPNLSAVNDILDAVYWS